MRNSYIFFATFYLRFDSLEKEKQPSWVVNLLEWNEYISTTTFFVVHFYSFNPNAPLKTDSQVLWRLCRWALKIVRYSNQHSIHFECKHSILTLWSYCVWFDNSTFFSMFLTYSWLFFFLILKCYTRKEVISSILQYISWINSFRMNSEYQKKIKKLIFLQTKALVMWQSRLPRKKFRFERVL